MPKHKILPFLYDPQYLVVNRTANQSIPNAVWTKPLYDVLVAANGMVYDNVLNRVIIPESAVYTINFSPRFVSSAVASTHGARILLNGVVNKVLLIPNIFITASDAAVPLSVTDFYAAGSVITTECFQNNGAAKNLSVQADLRTYLSIIRVSNT